MHDEDKSLQKRIDLFPNVLLLIYSRSISAVLRVPSQRCTHHHPPSSVTHFSTFQAYSGDSVHIGETLYVTPGVKQ